MSRLFIIILFFLVLIMGMIKGGVAGELQTLKMKKREGAVVLSLQNVVDVLLPKFHERILSDDIAIQINSHNDDINLKSKQDQLHVRITNFELLERNQRFRASIRLWEPDVESGEEIAFFGTYKELVQVPVLARALPGKVVLKPEHITTKLIDKRKLRFEIVENQEQLLGRALTHAMPADRPLRNRDVRKPLSVRRNANIKLIYETPSIHVETLATALEEGARGDMIRVKNVTSSKVVWAQIKDSGTAVVVR